MVCGIRASRSRQTACRPSTRSGARPVQGLFHQHRLCRSILPPRPELGARCPSPRALRGRYRRVPGRRAATRRDVHIPLAKYRRVPRVGVVLVTAIPSPAHRPAADRADAELKYRWARRDVRQTLPWATTPVHVDESSFRQLLGLPVSEVQVSRAGSISAVHPRVTIH